MQYAVLIFGSLPDLFEELVILAVLNVAVHGIHQKRELLDDMIYCSLSIEGTSIGHKNMP